MDRTVIKLDELRKLQTIEHYSKFLVQALVNHSHLVSAVVKMMNDTIDENGEEVMKIVNGLIQQFPMTNDVVGKLNSLLVDKPKSAQEPVVAEPKVVPKDTPKKNGNVINLFTREIIE